MTDLIPEADLRSTGLTRKELLEKFLAQLQKDFELAGLDDQFAPVSRSADESLPDWLARTLKGLDERHRLEDLLYRVDISEKQYAGTMRPGSYSGLAELVIKRVLQKVVLKIIYSKK